MSIASKIDPLHPAFQGRSGSYHTDTDQSSTRLQLVIHGNHMGAYLVPFPR